MGGNCIRRWKRSRQEGGDDVLSDFTPFLSMGDELLEALLTPGLCESVVVAIVYLGEVGAGKPAVSMSE